MGTLAWIIIAAVCLASGTVFGTMYGRQAEQKTIGFALSEFGKVDQAARTAVSRIGSALPYLKKHLHL